MSVVICFRLLGTDPLRFSYIQEGMKEQGAGEKCIGGKFVVFFQIWLAKMHNNNFFISSILFFLKLDVSETGAVYASGIRNTRIHITFPRNEDGNRTSQLPDTMRFETASIQEFRSS
jgi:hypothetical protein